MDSKSNTFDLDFSFEILNGQKSYNLINDATFKLNHIPLKITKINLVVDQYIEKRLINDYFDAEIYDDVQKLTYKINSGFIQTRKFF